MLRDQKESPVAGPGWPVRAVNAGFIATAVMMVVMLIAYGGAVLIGSQEPAAPILFRWIWALAHNPVTDYTKNALALAVLLHFVAGIGWAVLYAWLAEPRLRGAGWQRGLQFSLVPWLLSLVVFLPILGGGVFGLAVGAGPLPVIGNLLLHLVYGATLGTLYLQHADRVLTESGTTSAAEVEILSRSERVSAEGMLGGLALGAVVGTLAGLVVVPGQALPAAVLGALA